MLSKLPPVTVICIIPQGLLGDIQISLSNMFKRPKPSATCVFALVPLISQLSSILMGVLWSIDVFASSVFVWCDSWFDHLCVDDDEVSLIFIF